jgi:hypothetical protein
MDLTRYELITAAEEQFQTSEVDRYTRLLPLLATVVAVRGCGRWE